MCPRLRRLFQADARQYASSELCRPRLLLALQPKNMLYSWNTPGLLQGMALTGLPLHPAGIAKIVPRPRDPVSGNLVLSDHFDEQTKG